MRVNAKDHSGVCLVIDTATNKPIHDVVEAGDIDGYFVLDIRSECLSNAIELLKGRFKWDGVVEYDNRYGTVILKVYSDIAIVFSPEVNSYSYDNGISFREPITK